MSGARPRPEMPASFLPLAQEIAFYACPADGRFAATRRIRDAERRSVPTWILQRASTSRDASQVEAPDESQLVVGSSQRREGAHPGVQRSSYNARSTFGTRRSDAERMRRIVSGPGAEGRNACGGPTHEN